MEAIVKLGPPSLPLKVLHCVWNVPFRCVISEFEWRLALVEQCVHTFIEDRVYTLFYEGKSPFKLAIYTPEGHIKRSRDLNGREGGPKFDDRLVY